ncbi:MAG TPA: OadG family protein [Anaerovoracaceae bacterium]|nr:OadG family protein [Anaerovoracaceae bacterium]
MNELQLMQKFADPELFQSLSMVEKIDGSLVTALMGMGTTFIVLTLLWGIIALMARVINGKSGQKKVLSQKRNTDEMEVISVILGAILAGEDSGQIVKVAKVKQKYKNKRIKPKKGYTFNLDSIDL